MELVLYIATAVLVLAVLIFWRLGRSPRSSVPALPDFLVPALSEDSGRDSYEAFTAFYYRNPEPQRVTLSMRYVDRDETLTPDRALGPISGFYGEIFRANPENVADWISEIDKFSDRARYLFAAALWVAGTDAAKVYLGKLELGPVPRAPIELSELLKTEPPDLVTLTPNTPAAVDMLWGAFSATGEPIIIRNIVRATRQYTDREDLQTFMTAATARWSLASQAQSHEVVRSILSEEIARLQGEEQKLLSEVLEASESPTGPASLIRRTDQILKQQQASGRWPEASG